MVEADKYREVQDDFKTLELVMNKLNLQFPELEKTKVLVEKKRRLTTMKADV